MSEPSTKLKHSRFRHIFAKSVRRSEWYDAGAGHAIAVATNPKMIALSIEVPAGGVVQVAKLCTMGRGHMQMAKIKDHQGVVCDTKWNPFNDNVLATASHDATVRIWHIDDMLRIRRLRILRAHSRRVVLVEWHSTVDNALFSTSMDGRIVLWNIETDEIVYSINDCHATSLSLSFNCSEFAVTTRFRELIIFNARSGSKERHSELIHDGTMPPRVLYSGIQANQERLVTTGTCRNTRRQIAVYDSIHIDAPLAVIDVDSGSGLLMPIIDNDLNLLYVTGKGDTNIRFYELTNEPPYISYLNESCGHKAHTAVCGLPKRGLNVSQCEVMRIFRVDATQLVVEPLSFIVPRRADCFQADLFPATRSPTPSLLFREWLAGLDREPILLELKDCVLNCTNKPVTFCKESSSCAPKLITADINNDRKFRFLSKVTKPDYREVNEREDREELLKLEQIRTKIATKEINNVETKQQDSESVKSDAAVAAAAMNGDNDDDEENRCKSTTSEMAHEVVALNEKNTSMQKHVITPQHHLDIFIVNKSDLPHTPPAKNGQVLPCDNSSGQIISKECDDGLDRSVARSTESGIAFQAPTHLSPTRVVDNKNGAYEHGDDNTSARSSRSEEIIRELEKEVDKYQRRCEQLENIIRIQQEDIDSLRYEIRWKDGRIEFLQSQLATIDAAHSARSHSP